MTGPVEVIQTRVSYARVRYNRSVVTLLRRWRVQMPIGRRPADTKRRDDGVHRPVLLAPPSLSRVMLLGRLP